MDISHSIAIRASRSRVFSLYSEVTSWPAWDTEVATVKLAGLRPGESGWLKPRSGPKAAIRVVSVEVDRSFTIESRLPFCRVHFGHDLTGEDGVVTATHWVRFSGALAFLFRRLIGREIDRTLPATLADLKRASEAAASSG